MARKIMVVGNKFINFTKNENVVTIGQLEMLTKIPGTIFGDNTEFVPGQGICQDTLRNIFKDNCNEATINKKIDLSGLADFASEKINIYAHKSVKKNTLIGSCNQISSNMFTLPLIINENNELMSDHQTGQHVQGMILVEASRQAFIAVTEEFYMADKVGSSYYVINNMNIDFSSFMFPLPATIHYEMTERDINDRRSRFNATISILQNKKLCSSMSVRFTVYPSDVISSKESNLAGNVLADILNSHSAGTGYLQ
ncbi:hypothetical protein NLZ15_18390 [Atlantibacter subterranea]|uniref:AfsA-related hotdog domain-containing protein n=1 Tax=Atlantibacter subterraneus TaxID=255519 RepID=UPI0020C59EA3|nr:AfsA-related hotdog domain-containing protein [Atlantibacter subterranea]UTJ46772.1 hypothetical protein NLZ15_18390 [Atlantibacter subterranea]